MPNIGFATVDVSEVAAAHVRAAEKPTASGRYIVAAWEMARLIDMARCFRKMGGSMFVPEHVLPDVLVRMLVGLTQKWIERNLGVRFAVDNSRSIKELGIEYRPLEDTLREHYKAWKA